VTVMERKDLETDSEKNHTLILVDERNLLVR